MGNERDSSDIYLDGHMEETQLQHRHPCKLYIIAHPLAVDFLLRELIFSEIKYSKINFMIFFSLSIFNQFRVI